MNETLARINKRMAEYNDYQTSRYLDEKARAFAWSVTLKDWRLALAMAACAVAAYEREGLTVAEYLLDWDERVKAHVEAAEAEYGDYDEFMRGFLVNP